MSNFTEVFKYICVVFIILLVIFNIGTEREFLNKEYLARGSQNFPGQMFLPLRPYLKNVRMAGYYTGQDPKAVAIDENFMYIFQRAQFALTPTMLDYFRPLTHEYIILYNQDRASQEKILQQVHAVPVAVGRNFTLIRQILK